MPMFIVTDGHFDSRFLRSQQLEVGSIWISEHSVKLKYAGGICSEMTLAACSCFCFLFFSTCVHNATRIKFLITSPLSA